MVNSVQDVWTDEKIGVTVTTHFVYSHLGEAAQLSIPDTVDSIEQTYAQRIVAKSKRLFLILVDVGIPQQICRLIDEFYDDDYLPFVEDEVASLRLAQSGKSNLDELFYRQQFKYLLRVLHDGEHIRYANVESVPIQIIEQKASSVSNDGTDKVRLPSPINQVFMRRHHHLRDNQIELDLLSEIAAAKSLNHEHLLSVYGSYTQGDDMYILLSPVSKWTLKNFLGDLPKAYEALPKPMRRSLLLEWPHCLSNALTWLHSNGGHHGAIRPSRIFVDENFQISLGNFEGEWLLASSTQKDDLESYQYAAPEFWKRGLTVQSHSSSSGFALGGRSAGTRLHIQSRANDEKSGGNDDAAGTERSLSSSNGSTYTFVPAFKGNSSRLKLKIANRLSTDLSSMVRAESRQNYRGNPSSHASSHPARSLSRRFNALSMHSSNSSEAGKHSESQPSRLTHSVPINTKTTVVQSWKSKARNMTAADMFSLAAITMDIMTVLCSRSISSFARHRATKNRQAGRGGGLADASFHANLSQVVGWAEILLKDAEKKVKKDNGQMFRAVEPTLQSMIQCFDKDPSKRPRADVLSLELRKHLSDFAGVKNPHCYLRLPERRRPSETKSKIRSENSLHILNSQDSLIEERVASSSQSRQPYRSDTQPSLQKQYTQHPITPPSTSNQSLPNQPFTPPTNPRNSAAMNLEDEEPVSPDLFDYYESHWKDPQYKQYRSATRIVGSLEHDDRVGFDNPQPPMSAVSYNSGYHSMHSEAAMLPPSRDLPAVPTSIYAVQPSQRQASKRPISPQHANVAHATQMLAQTIGHLGR